MVSQGSTSGFQLNFVFLVIVVENSRLVAVLRGDGVGAVAELEVLGLGELLYQSLADGLGFALRDVLLEVEHTACLDVSCQNGSRCIRLLRHP